MARIEWEYQHPRATVWAAIENTGHWPMNLDSFRPVPGEKFRGGPFPAISTDYTGQLHCEVTEAVACRLLCIRACAPKNTGVATVWEIRSELSETAAGGTSLVTNVYGVNTDDPQERILLNIVGTVARRIYSQASQDLDPPPQSRQSPTDEARNAVP